MTHSVILSYLLQEASTGVEVTEELVVKVICKVLQVSIDGVTDEGLKLPTLSLTTHHGDKCNLIDYSLSIAIAFLLLHESIFI